MATIIIWLVIYKKKYDNNNIKRPVVKNFNKNSFMSIMRELLPILT